MKAQSCTRASLSYGQWPKGMQTLGTIIRMLLSSKRNGSYYNTKFFYNQFMKHLSPY